MNIKVYAVLNNYQMGSYAHSCLSGNIIKEDKLDWCHTKVIWNITEPYQMNLLNKAIGNKKLKIID